MTDRVCENKLPAPAIKIRKPEEQSLDLASVDMSKTGVTGNMAVSKGEASTFVSIVPGREKAAEDD